MISNVKALNSVNKVQKNHQKKDTFKIIRLIMLSYMLIGFLYWILHTLAQIEVVVFVFHQYEKTTTTTNLLS